MHLLKTQIPTQDKDDDCLNSRLFNEKHSSKDHSLFSITEEGIEIFLSEMQPSHFFSQMNYFEISQF